MRESGCLSFLNKLNINISNQKHPCINIICCHKEFYAIKYEDYPKVQVSKKQYVYGIINHRHELLFITHNHKILRTTNWAKEDQLKQKDLQSIKFNSGLNIKLIIEANQVHKVKLLEKEEVFDITLHHYSNFLVHNSIVHNSIEQDADLILMLYKNIDEDSDDKIDITVAKHRNGPIGSFRLLFYAETCKFSNVKTSSILDIY